MSTLTAVASLSSSATLVTEAELEALLEQALTFNRSVGVTGVLLHHDGSFFQYFEGPEDAVAQVYARIHRSGRHYTIFELCRGPITQVFFADWQMGFAQTPKSAILQLSQAEWTATGAAIDGAERPTEGLELVADYWKAVAPWGARH
ncbi:BLUF domain-containing protein [Pseudorhodoferax sp. Leaf267]|uniref:BLUF domain-containing protein n=1 Tax=Pseudorhodoferax sp. Leaf267 TaxID=1736316 RepID=UPI0006F2CDE4|nr:BLUF domain-containing protein [Pseudorhodoferax sp. Leaf267]KQP23088.1 hypothetical protein ASF43_04180 [Pseudorhodoferax sp. Leaf267]